MAATIERKRRQASTWTKNLRSWRWRFTHLYWIKPAAKKPAILFEPRPEQWEILEAIYETGNTRLAILKARQLGFSTLLALVCLDWLLFRPGVNIAIVDLTAEKAEEKLAKIDFAWGKLPARLKRRYLRTWRANKMTLRLRRPVLNPDTGKREPDATRFCRAGKRARGDTFQLLWVSEWGPIQKEDGNRSDEIADGALPAADKGTVVVETTWRGGKSGRLWSEVVDPALKIADDDRIPRDWRVCFFAWWLDPTLVYEGPTKQISPECAKYLREVQKKIGRKLSGPARLWYFKVAWPKRHKRYEEYPSFMAEMFMSQSPGAIYREEMAELRARPGLTKFAVEPAFRVFAAFDLGRDDAMPCVLVQVVGKEIRVVDYYTNNREQVSHYVSWLKKWDAGQNDEKGTVGITIMLPHDSRTKSLAHGVTVEERFDELTQDMKGWEVVSVDVIPSVWDGIDHVRDIFPNLWLNAASPRIVEEVAVKPGEPAFPSLVDCLDLYHQKEVIEGHNITREPVHDMASHGCDSLRTFAEGYAKGSIDTRTQGRNKKKTKVITGHGEVAKRVRGGRKHTGRVRRGGRVW